MFVRRQHHDVAIVTQVVDEHVAVAHILDEHDAGWNWGLMIAAGACLAFWLVVFCLIVVFI
jgi:PII-like signaling protein